jgi:hypothetical protein
LSGDTPPPPHPPLALNLPGLKKPRYPMDIQSYFVQEEQKIIFFGRIDLLDVAMESFLVFSYGQIIKNPIV